MNMPVVDKLSHEPLQTNGDPRISLYPFMGNPASTIIFSAVYFIVTLVGVHLMKNRQPCGLKIPLFLYSLGVVLLSTWMLLKLGTHGWFTKYSWSCEPIHTSNDPDASEIVKVCWIFYISRLVEFFDTVFLVLNKSKISHFHILHRCVIPIAIWYAVKYGPGGYNTFPFMADSFVRIWLYLYYGISAILPAVQKYALMKNCLSYLQMAQFLSVIVYMSRLAFYPPPDCGVSQLLVGQSLGHGIVSLAVAVYIHLSTSRKSAAKGIEKYKKK